MSVELVCCVALCVGFLTFVGCGSCVFVVESWVFIERDCATDKATGSDPLRDISPTCRTKEGHR